MATYNKLEIAPLFTSLRHFLSSSLLFLQCSTSIKKKQCHNTFPYYHLFSNVLHYDHSTCIPFLYLLFYWLVIIHATRCLIKIQPLLSLLLGGEMPYLCFLTVIYSRHSMNKRSHSPHLPMDVLYHCMSCFDPKTIIKK